MASVVVAVIAGAATVAAGVLLYHTHLTASGALGALVVFVITYLPAQPLAHAVSAALGPTAGQPLFPVRDLVVLVLWAAAGLVIAGATFQWEPHRVSGHRPARAPRPAAPTKEVST